MYRADIDVIYTDRRKHAQTHQERKTYTPCTVPSTPIRQCAPYASDSGNDLLLYCLPGCRSLPANTAVTTFKWVREWEAKTKGVQKLANAHSQFAFKIYIIFTQNAYGSDVWVCVFELNPWPMLHKSFTVRFFFVAVQLQYKCNWNGWLSECLIHIVLYMNAYIHA